MTLVLLLVGALALLHQYLQSNEEKLVREYAYPAGLDIVFREVDITAWSTFPRISLSVDSLVIRDSLRTTDEPALLATDNLHAEFSLTSLFGDTISLRAITLTGGNIFLDADSTGTYNVGSLLGGPEEEPADTTAQSPKEISWDGVRVNLLGVDFAFRNPTKRKRIEAYLDTLQAVATRSDSNTVELTALLRTHFGQLGLNTDKGAYLTDVPLSGTLSASFGAETITVPPARLHIGTQWFDASAVIDRDVTALSRIEVAADTAAYAVTQQLLPADLRAKLDDFYVSGQFPARAIILTPLKRGGDPEVTIDFRLTGQDVRVKEYGFTDVHTRGRIVNRLEPWEGGIPGSKKNMRVTLDSTSTYYLGARIEAPRATVAVFGRDARLRAPLTISGPSSAVSDYLENRDFFFDRGTFVLQTEIDASLLSFEEIATTSDGTMTFEDLEVVYQPANVRFPFRNIRVTKDRQDVDFRIQSFPLSTGVSFELRGQIDNLKPLLVDAPGETIHSDVTLLSPRIDWSDFLGFFGEDGYFAPDETDSTTAAVLTAAEVGEQTRAMKSAMLGVRSTFHPDISVHFDTVAYYDVLTVTDFATGLNFAGDTLVLQETTFNWAGSDLLLGAQLDLGITGRTPFHLMVEGEHIDLNALRSSLDYFGVQIPEGIDELPSDLSIDFNHTGRIADSLGIEPGYNAGRLVFNDGYDDLFDGLLQYEPGPNGLSTDLHLAGDPQLVNYLFRSTNFFFGSGTFAIDLCVEGNPVDVQELLNNGELHLRIDSSRVDYRPGQVFVPVQAFEVNVKDGSADYQMHLLTELGQRSVRFDGELDHFAAFLYPENGETFTMRAAATAPILRWSDLRGFVQLNTGNEPDTTDQGFDPQTLLSATTGVFESFRPDVSLRIDTFWAGNRTPLIDLHSGFRLRDSTMLLLEKSGFTLDGGDVEFEASYALDTTVISPFTANWRTDTLALEDVLEELRFLDVPIPENVGVLRGQLTMSGTLEGLLNEATGMPLMDSTHGRVTYRLSDAELTDWPMLARLGKKTRMQKRFERLHFAPLEGIVLLDSGRVVVPRTEIQSTALQLFIEGNFTPENGANMLISIPLRNIGRGVLERAPDPTGYALAGWKVYLVQETGKDGETKTKFRLGRRRYFKERGRLEEWRQRREAYREERRKARRERRRN